MKEGNGLHRGPSPSSSPPHDGQLGDISPESFARMHTHKHICITLNGISPYLLSYPWVALFYLTRKVVEIFAAGWFTEQH